MSNPLHLTADGVLVRPGLAVRVENEPGLWVVDHLEATAARLRDPLRRLETRATYSRLTTHRRQDITPFGTRRED